MILISMCVPKVKSTQSPSNEPSESPTLKLSLFPTFIPTINPTAQPTLIPTQKPTVIPSQVPSLSPSWSLFPTPAPNLLQVYSARFNYTGAQQTFVVPAGTPSVEIEACGANGGGYKGFGGCILCTVSVAYGQTLYIYVGQSGGTSAAFNGGGPCSGDCSGGGASDVRRGGTALTNRIAVAGAGGGSVNVGIGGNGGGYIGATGPGTCPLSPILEAGGGTQLSGGNGGLCGAQGGGAGSFGQGGAASNYYGAGGTVNGTYIAN